MKVLRIAFFIYSIMIITLICHVDAMQSSPTKSTERSVAAQGTGTTRAAWEEEWDRVKAAARKEGKVVIIGNVGPAAEVLKKVMNDKFGINPEFMAGRGAEVAQKIITEQNAGIYSYDV